MYDKKRLALAGNRLQATHIAGLPLNPQWLLVDSSGVGEPLVAASSTSNAGDEMTKNPKHVIHNRQY